MIMYPYVALSLFKYFGKVELEREPFLYTLDLIEPCSAHGL